MNKNALRNAEAGLVNKMRSHYDSEFDAANAHVRKSQAQVKSMYGGHAKISQEAMNTDSYMCNDGMHAQKFADKLTKGLDEKAYPLKK